MKNKGKLKWKFQSGYFFLYLSLKEEEKNNGIILCTLKNGNSSQDTFLYTVCFIKPY